MWKVEDTTYMRSMFEPVDLFVKDFWEWAIRNQGKVGRELDEEIIRTAGSFGKVVRDLPKLQQLLTDLATSENIGRVKSLYEEVTADYEGYLEAGATPISLETGSESLYKRVFDYFYKEVLDCKTFGAAYSDEREPFSKSRYRQKISRLYSICPYCDMNDISYERYSNVDHFLPNLYFPLLAVHWENLVVSCTSCNQYIKGKKPIGTHHGKRNYIPIFHPFLHQFADHIRFTFEQGEIGVQSVAVDSIDQERVQNYCSLFKIEDVYGRQDKSIQRVRKEIRGTVKRRFKAIREQEEANMDCLKQLFHEEVRAKRELIHSGKGHIALTKFLTDYCAFLEEPAHFERELYFLASELGISFQLKQV